MSVRLGFLGLGWIGRMRLEAVVREGLAEVFALADVDEACLAAASAIAPKAWVAHGLDHLLDMPLDGLVIATPNDGHALQTVEALSAGIPVFCQKPLGRTSAETRAAVGAARATDRLLGVDMSYRRTRVVEAVVDQLASGTLGTIYKAEFVFHNAYGPDKAWASARATAGGGCLLDLGTHLIDLACLTFGSPVRGTTGVLFGNGVRLGIEAAPEDFATARLTFDHGAIADVACSWRLPLGRPAAIEWTWHGTRGGLRVVNVCGSFYDFLAERLDGAATTTLVSPPDAWQGRTLHDWIRRLESGTGYDPAVESLVPVAEAIDAVYASPEQK